MGILPHQALKEMIHYANYDYHRIDPWARVLDEDAFHEMTSYLYNMYEEIESVHSFEDPAGQVFDCVPIAQQPSLRGSSAAVPRAPDLRPVLEGRPAVPGPEQVETPAQPAARRDRHGNIA